MKLNYYEKLKLYKADMVDVGLTKWAVFSATLLLAKLWEPVLSLNWYWYLLIFLVAVIRPMVNFIKQLKG